REARAGGGDDLVALATEGDVEHLAQAGLVVDDQHLRWCRRDRGHFAPATLPDPECTGRRGGTDEDFVIRTWDAARFTRCQEPNSKKNPRLPPSLCPFSSTCKPSRRSAPRPPPARARRSGSSSSRCRPLGS